MSTRQHHLDKVVGEIRPVKLFNRPNKYIRLDLLAQQEIDYIIITPLIICRLVSQVQLVCLCLQQP